MEKILVVDDHESNRNMLRQLLQIKGYQVIEAFDGQHAIELFKQEQPDLILMDIMMPVMDGHESARAIKSICGDEYVPIIFITALSTDESLTKTLDAGGDDFVGKPFSFDVIQSKITAHLRIRKLTQQLAEQNAYIKHENVLINHFFENALQQSFLDERYIKYLTSPMSAYNGDVILSERGPLGGLYMIMGDFTGHGLAASLGILPLSQLFFKMARSGAGISKIVSEINTQLKHILPIGMFFAANILYLDPSGSFITIWTGGLMEGFHFNAEGEEKSLIPSKNPPLGVLPEDMFKPNPQVIPVDKGDQIYFYSDGVIESRNADDEMFGDKRLHDVVKNHTSNRIDAITGAMKEFCGERKQTDDITIVELTCDAIPAEEKWATEDHPPVPFQCDIEFDEQMIREQEPIQLLTQMMNTQPILKRHCGRIQTLLTELYNNAVEFSLLGLDAAMKANSKLTSEYNKLRDSALEQLQDARLQVRFSIEYPDNQARLKLTIKDNGQGIKQQDIFASNNGLAIDDIQIIRDLVTGMLYSEEGRRVDVVYKLS